MSIVQNTMWSSLHDRCWVNWEI